ncbi:MAG: glycosyltransferase family 39 protein [Rhodospirillaceae bacterium]
MPTTLRQRLFTIPEQWPLALTAAAFACVALVAAATFRDYGIGWDEHVQDIYGQKLLAYYLSGFHDQSVFTYLNLRFYGGFFDLLAAAINRVSPFGEFETRHLLGAAIFLVGLVGAWRLTRLLAGDRAAALAVVCLAATPPLYGHAFINPKDSPFAWLLVWVTYFSCRLLAERETAALSLCIGFGISLGLALGTKVFAGAYMGYLIGFMIVAAAMAWSRGDRREALAEMRAASRVMVYALPAACAVMVFFWPWVAQAPGNFVGSIETFLRFPHEVPVLWNGEVLSSSKPPFNYLLVMLALKLPEFALLGLVLAGGLAVRAVWRSGTSALHQPRSRQFLFVAVTALVPVAMFVVLRPTVYNGLRQYLFVLPPVVILGAVGLDRAVAAAIQWNRAAGYAAGSLLALAIMRQVGVMNGLHPYEYVAFNALDGNLAHVGQEFELDYWGTSLAEASRDLPEVLARLGRSQPEAAHTPQIYVCGDRLSAEYFMPRTLQITDKIDAADFLMATDAAVCRNLMRRSTGTLLEIRREGAVLSRILDLRQHAAAGNHVADPNHPPHLTR